jgi:hypothetical protein
VKSQFSLDTGCCLCVCLETVARDGSGFSEGPSDFLRHISFRIMCGWI